MKKRKNAVDATAFIGKKIRKLGKHYEKHGLGRASQVEINTPGHNGSFNQIPNQANGLIDIRLLGDNTPDGVLRDFEDIKQQVEEKTKTKIIPTVISKGAPIRTSKTLNQNWQIFAREKVYNQLICLLILVKTQDMYLPEKKQ